MCLWVFPGDGLPCSDTHRRLHNLLFQSSRQRFQVWGSLKWMSTKILLSSELNLPCLWLSRIKLNIMGFWSRHCMSWCLCPAPGEFKALQSNTWKMTASQSASTTLSSLSVSLSWFVTMPKKKVIEFVRAKGKTINIYSLIPGSCFSRHTHLAWPASLGFQDTLKGRSPPSETAGLCLPVRERDNTENINKMRHSVCVSMCVSANPLVHIHSAAQKRRKPRRRENKGGRFS